MTSFFIIMAALPLLFVVLVHIGFKAPRIVEQGTPGDFGMTYRRVEIETKHGRELFAWVLEPSKKPNAPFLLILHGWGANAEMMLPLAEPFYRAGINILLIDARNHGRSASDGHSSMPKFAEDAGYAIDWLKKEAGARGRKIALLGHSVGAAAVLLTASRRSDIDAVISISSFAHPEWLMRRQLQRIRILCSLAPLLLRYVELIIGHRFGEIAPVNTLCRIKCPVLLVHGLKDETIPVSCLQAIERSCPNHRPEVLLIPDAGHASIGKIRKHAGALHNFLKRAGL